MHFARGRTWHKILFGKSREGKARQSKNVSDFFFSLCYQISGHLLDKILLHLLNNLTAHKKSYHAAAWLQTVNFF